MLQPQKRDRPKEVRTMRLTALERTKDLPTPRLADLLFKTWLGAILLLPLRLYFGWEWVKAGWEKVTDPAWMSTGKAVSGFAAGALKNGTAGDHPAVAYGFWQDWLGFLRDATWFTPTFAKLVAVGEVAIGAALILGAFVGIAAFFGATLNLSFMLSGSAGVNPAFLAAQILLIAAWRVAGQLGADHWLLDRLGTIRQPGRWFAGRRTPTTPTPNPA
jgi:thiosulfate dehydrogenase (quinone) large subunit